MTKAEVRKATDADPERDLSSSQTVRFPAAALESPSGSLSSNG